METLHDPAARAKIERRIGALCPGSPRVWGKMTPAQMLCHCSIALEAATGEKPMKQIFVGRILGPLFRKKMLGPEPFGRDAPTGKVLIVADERDFASERARILGVIGRFADAGPAAADAHVHGFLGPLPGHDWGRLMHKHLDHHLTQFGV